MLGRLEVPIIGTFLLIQLFLLFPCRVVLRHLLHLREELRTLHLVLRGRLLVVDTSSSLLVVAVAVLLVLVLFNLPSLEVV